MVSSSHLAILQPLLLLLWLHLATALPARLFLHQLGIKCPELLTTPSANVVFGFDEAAPVLVGDVTESVVHCVVSKPAGGCGIQSCLMFDPSLHGKFYQVQKCLSQKPIGLSFTNFQCIDRPVKVPGGAFRLAGHCGHGVAMYKKVDWSVKTCKLEECKASISD